MSSCRDIKKILLVLWILMVCSPSLDAREIILLTCEEPPTNYIHDNDIIGTSVDIVQAILNQLGQKKQSNYYLGPGHIKQPQISQTSLSSPAA